MCMITPYNGEVPATITVDWTAYTVLGNDWVTRKIYGNEPLVWIFQPDTENQVNYISTFLRKLDTALSDTSENAVQNKVVKAWLDLKANTADLWAAAFSNDYDDLDNKPTIGDATLTVQQNSVVKGTFTANATQNQIVNIEVPTKISDLTDDSDFVNDYELANVAFTGNYANLINTPTIGDATFIVQKNGVEVWRTTANATSASVANILVPNVIDNLTSTSTWDSLSANQGKVLYEKVQNLEARWRFLSNWNCATWLPETNPETSPYLYKAWDYYIVSVLASSWNDNYKPNWTSYTIWVASTTVDPNLELWLWDTYIYDGTSWIWQKNTQKTVSFPNIAGDAMDNISLAWYFNAKQDKILAGTNITINADGKTINAVMPSLNDASTVTKGIVKIASDTVQTEAAQTASSTANRTYPIQNNSNGQLVVNVPWEDTQPTPVSDATSSTKWVLKLWSDTVQTTAPENVSSTNNRTYALQVNNSGQWVVNVPWTDTTYTAWTNVTIDPNDNNKISVNIPAYSSATSSTAWVVKLWSDTVQNEWANTPSSTTGKTYAIQVNSNDQMVVNIPWENTTYNAATQSDAWLMSAADKTKLDGIATWATANTGTLTEIVMNGVSQGTSWSIDLWTVLTSHQSIKTINWNTITGTWNLSLYSSISITLAAADWSSNEQTVTATWATASNIIIVSPDTSNMDDYASNKVYCSAQASNSLTFSCDTEPENDIVVNVLIMN